MIGSRYYSSLHEMLPILQDKQVTLVGILNCFLLLGDGLLWRKNSKEWNENKTSEIINIIIPRRSPGIANIKNKIICLDI